MRAQIQRAIDIKTKPLGALGQLEKIALQIGLIQNTTTPKIKLPHLVVFAADHGIAATGLVNPYPQAVTAQMVKNFLNRGAAINVFCRQNKMALTIVDAGVNANWSEDENSHENFLIYKQGYGTANYAEGSAMSEEQCLQAIEKGREVVKHISNGGCNTIGFGEMGIGNTSSASLIMSSILQCAVTECVGNGTGVNEAQLQIKKQTLEQVAALHKIETLNASPIKLLAAIGGFEIAMLCGAYLQAADEGMVILVDGFISTAALLVAHTMQKEILTHCIFAHSSGEQGHKKILAYLGAKPLLQLGMRLGEGTGAALALPLVQASVNFLNEMASFESANVTPKA